MRDSGSMADEHGFVTDASGWPLVYVRFPSRAISDAALESFIAQYDAYLEQRHPFAMICDARGMKQAINAPQRRRLARWLDEAHTQAGKYNVATAVILKSTIIRGALTAVFWLRQPAPPTKAFESIADAARWIRHRFQAAGVPITPEIDKMLAGV